MVPPPMKLSMGQAGLCAVGAPLTDSNSPLISTEEGQSNANGSIDDIQTVLSQLMENYKELNVEDVLQKLQSVIFENVELKDTIAQNNMALRQQLNLIVQWNQQVENQQRQSRQTINDINKQLSTCQHENSLLHSSLSSIKTSGSTDSKYQEWHETFQKLNKQLEQENVRLERAIEEKELLLSHRTKLEGEITLLKCDLTASRGESERLHLKVQDSSSIIKDLRQKLIDRDIICTKINNEHSKENSEDTISTLLMELQDTRRKIDSLESELKVANVDVIKYKSRYNNLSNKEQFETIPTASGKQTTDDPEKRKLRDEAAMLREEVDNLEATLSEERKRVGEERTTVSRMHTEMIRLKRENNGFRDKWDKNEYNDQYYQVKLRSVHEQHDEATAKLVSYEELLGSKNYEISRYKKELGEVKAQLIDLKSESETIAILRAQVEVYQSDFRAEREAREALATDREKLRDEMRHLHTRNTQLIDELETYQRRHIYQGSGRSPRAGSEEMNYPNAGGKDLTAAFSSDFSWEKLSVNSDNKEEEKKKDDTDEVDENLLYCPKCNKTFTELRPLEEHVNKCLDED